MGKYDDNNDGWFFSVFTFFDEETWQTIWGFALILVAIPFIVLFLTIPSFCNFFTSHLVICFVIYSAASLIIGIFCYMSKENRHRVVGVFATTANLLPAVLATIFYSVPYVITKPGLSSSFDFVLVSLFSIGIEFFVLYMAKMQRNGLKHFAYSAILIAVYLLLLKNRITSPEIWAIYMC